MEVKIQWQRDLGKKIDQLKAINYESLLEKYALKTKHKIEALGKLSKTLVAELANRNLSDVPTEKLLDMQLKIYSHVEKITDNLKYFEPKTSLEENLRDFNSHCTNELTLSIED